MIRKSLNDVGINQNLGQNKVKMKLSKVHPEQRHSFPIVEASFPFQTVCTWIPFNQATAKRLGNVKFHLLCLLICEFYGLSSEVYSLATEPMLRSDA
jgi:hypothetical protein